MSAEARTVSARPTWPRSPGAVAPRVLLLTSNLGAGHSRAAKAIELALLSRVPAAQVRTLDLWSLMHASVADTVRQTYLRLVQAHPDLYESIYQLDERTWRRIIDGERVVTVSVGSYFAGGIETEEQLEAALEGVREECARLIGAGKKVIVQ